jgi:hypothetical protein
MRNTSQYENELINDRLSWLGTLQGLLFAALAVAWSEPSAKYLLWIICGVGFAVAVSIGVGTYRANRVLDKSEPRETNPWLRQLWRLMPGRVIPGVFAVAWLLIFLVCIWSREPAGGSMTFPFP